MDIINIIEKLNLQHPSKLKDGEIAYLVFNDGEIVLTKSGSLLWNRTLHIQYPSLPNCKKITLPYTKGNYTFAHVINIHDAIIIRNMCYSRLVNE